MEDKKIIDTIEVNDEEYEIQPKTTGNLEELETENKNTIVEAINEVNGKHLYRNTITIHNLYEINNDDTANYILCFNSSKVFNDFKEVLEYIDTIPNNYFNLDFKMYNIMLDNEYIVMTRVVPNIKYDDYGSEFMNGYNILIQSEVCFYYRVNTTFEFENTLIY